MKLILTTLLIILSFNISANSHKHIADLLIDISHQVNDVQTIIDAQGKHRISRLDQQKLKEYHATLVQLIFTSPDNERIKHLYHSIHDILYPRLGSTNHSDDKAEFSKGQGSSSLRGLVTLGPNDLAVMYEEVRVFHIDGSLAAFGYTDQLGRYTIDDIEAGSYVIMVFTDQKSATAYPNISCFGGPGVGCTIADLPTVEIQQDQVLESINININMAASPSIFISGQVSDAINDSAINVASVTVYDINQNPVKSTFTSVFGKYNLSLEAAGEYYIKAANSDYLSTVYDDVLCINGCDFSEATVLELSLNDNVEDINFSLYPQGGISGSLIDAETKMPITDANIRVFNEQGQSVSFVDSDYDGSWQSNPLPRGNYKIVSRDDDYLATLHEGLPCNNAGTFSCDLEQGLSIFHDGFNTSDVILTQIKGAKIRGLVQDSLTSVALSSATIKLYTAQGQEILAHTKNTDAQGNYESYHLGNSDFYLVASKSGYNTTLYPNVHCLQEECDFSNGSLISINSLKDVNNINFTLDKTVSISGKVVDEENIPINLIKIYLRNIDGSNQRSTFSDENGEYRFSNVSTGNYQAYISESQGYDAQSYQNHPCVNNCLDAPFTPIVIETNDIDDIDFSLTRQVDDLSTFSGIVTNDQGSALPDMRVVLRENNRNFVQTTTTDGAGFYRFTHVPEGSYQVFSGGRQGYQLKSYDDLTCLDDFCEGDDFTPLTGGSSDIEYINFQLSIKPHIHFVLQSNSSNEVDRGRIKVYDEDGTINTFFSINENIELEAGNYYFVYSSRSDFNPIPDRFALKVYGGSSCLPHCDVTAGTLVHFDNTSNVILSMNIDEFFYVDLQTSQDLVMTYELYNEDLSLYESDYYQQSKRVYIRDQADKILKLSSQGHYSQLFEGIECIESSCDLSQANLIQPLLNTSLIVNSQLNPIASLSGQITDQNGEPLDNVKIVFEEELNQSGARIVYSDHGFFSIDAISNSSYFIKAMTNEERYAQTFYGNISCETSNCEDLSIPKVTVNPGDSLTNIDIIMNDRGTISGDGILNLNGQAEPSRIWLYNQSTQSISGLDHVNYDGTMSPQYLVEGDYKIIVSSLSNQVYSLYPDIICGTELYDCADIDPNLSTTFSLSNGVNTHFSGFPIHQQGVLSGLISFQSPSSSNSTEIKLYDVNDPEKVIDVEVQSHSNDTFYRLPLDKGEYKLFISNDHNIDQLYDNIDCYGGLNVGCTLDQGHIIAIDYDTHQGVDIVMRGLPSINAQLKNAVSDEVIDSDIVVFDDNQSIVYSGFATHHDIRGLLPGSYFVIASGGTNYTITGYPDIECTNNNSMDSCLQPLTAIDLSINENLKNINIFSILKQGINGFVTDKLSSESIKNIVIDVWDDTPRIVDSLLTNAAGGFSSTLDNGNYYLSTDTNNNYINQIFNNIICETPAILGNCDITMGESLIVNAQNNSPIMLDIDLSVDQIFEGNFEDG